MKNKAELISVIVAVYNVESYIGACLDSIVGQTYSNIEIIVVNDGSTDQTGKVVDNYAKRDPRIVLINIDNGGAAKARNTAIEVAKGTYISIVDGDDTVEPTFLEDLYTSIRTSDADISSCEYYLTYEDGRPTTLRGGAFGNEGLVMTRSEVIKDYLLENSLVHPVFWNKLYKLSIFKENGLLIPEGDIYEDSRFLYKIYHYADKLAYQPKPLYKYLQRGNSVMGVQITQKDIDALRKMIEEVKSWMRDRYNSEFSQDVFAFEVGVNMNIINFMVDKSNILNHEWKTSTIFIRNNIKKILLESNNISLKRKVGCVLTLTGINLYKSARKLM